MKLIPKIVISGITAVSITSTITGYFVIAGISDAMSKNVDNRLAGDSLFAATRISERQAQIRSVTQIISQTKGVASASTETRIFYFQCGKNDQPALSLLHLKQDSGNFTETVRFLWLIYSQT